MTFSLPRAALGVFLALAAGAAAAQGTCIYPRPPENIPDGATATREQMVAAFAAVKQFDTDIAAYNACLELELQSILANPELADLDKERLRAMQAQKNNAAVDHAEQVAQNFNDQLRAFNARPENKKN
ncbi:MAG: hypothetical protein MUC71_04595 [Steroidobacteraceae bacterium]|jgi:hypothetical protein|nr:hypothetical protein [Steroidobacteraceae bacterium]